MAADPSTWDAVGQDCMNLHSLDLARCCVTSSAQQGLARPEVVGRFVRSGRQNGGPSEARISTRRTRRSASEEVIVALIPSFNPWHRGWLVGEKPLSQLSRRIRH